ncbi:MAG: cation diffusion facilitator family transporter [Lachnospiraceae bacterium]|nr:cation diffusion facilitator family transporter [Lachnospiraceae bacterium]
MKKTKDAPGGESTLLSRDKSIIRISLLGIAANVLLSSFKAVVGFLSSSIAIVLDAVNNLSDALSSVITIIGTAYANKKPDREHPLGHGRAEYLSAAVIAVIVLYAGITSLIESVKKIITPVTPDYSAITLVILFIAVFVKIALGLYYRKQGKKLNSDALAVSGQDALQDAVISASTILAAGIYIFTGLSLEAWLGVIIALVILKAGYEILSRTLSEILGERVHPKLSADLKRTVADFEEVHGVYDLILHNYGPDKYLGSLHIEIDDDKNADEIDDLTRAITRKVYAEHGVILEAVGIYAVNRSDPETAAMREKVMEIIYSHDYILQTHGFHVDFEPKVLNVDIIIDFQAPDRGAIFDDIVRRIGEAYPDFQLGIVMDIDASD